METAIVLFTRDLRLHDNPALHQACSRATAAPTGS
jgi:deoxyribodipyrimidine photolyase